MTFNPPGRRSVLNAVIAEALSWTKPDVCRVDRRRLAIRPPEANGGGVSASRFAGAGSTSRSDRYRKCVTAPPTESRRWPEPPSSVRQLPLGCIFGCGPLRSRTGVRTFVDADRSGQGTGVRRFVRADRSGRGPASADLFVSTVPHPHAGTRATSVVRFAGTGEYRSLEPGPIFHLVGVSPLSDGRWAGSSYVVRVRCALARVGPPNSRVASMNGEVVCRALYRMRRSRTTAPRFWSREGSAGVSQRQPASLSCL